MFSTAPVYKDLEQLLLGDLLARMCEIRGADDELCQKMLAGKSPIERGAELIAGTKLDDPEVRKQIAGGGMAAIESSDDALIQLALLVDPTVRADRKFDEEQKEIERQAYAQIADAQFRMQGTSVYPDATFTLRLAFGPVKGYQVKGESIPPFTDVTGTFAHAEKHAGTERFRSASIMGKSSRQNSRRHAHEFCLDSRHHRWKLWQPRGEQGARIGGPDF